MHFALCNVDYPLKISESGSNVCFERVNTVVNLNMCNATSRFDDIKLHKKSVKLPPRERKINAEEKS